MWKYLENQHVLNGCKHYRVDALSGIMVVSLKLKGQFLHV